MTTDYKGNHYPIRHDDGAIDKRYSVALEHCGFAEKRLVLRFCGDFLGGFSDISGATLRAINHKAHRLGVQSILEYRHENVI